ncbi:haloalkane dehalogenase [Aliiglaciecola litoralis]|uniref:Haloalkane dehalogenase n=1 Tax=Aliiglaciecola litoralis TaxID=582857 RepID=A0ABN1LCZ1_9ALTE
MEYLRTPDSCFSNLPDYDFTPHYIEVDDFEGASLRMHYVDEGPKDAPVVLMLHGEPSWSFLYRNMITQVSQQGFRVIAPDLIGFGRSDKPTKQTDYTYQRHVDWLSNLISMLKLNDITLVCQDWGGLLGLRLVADYPNNFARVCAANTFLPTGNESLGKAFHQWKEFSQQVPIFPAGGIIKGATTTELSEQVINAYNAPFPDESYKAGARVFPLLVPASPQDPASVPNQQAWQKLKQWRKPFLTAFSDSDPVTAGGDKIFQKLIPGCQGQQHTTIKNAGHFLQEDQSEVFAKVVIDFMQNNK